MRVVHQSIFQFSQQTLQMSMEMEIYITGSELLNSPCLTDKQFWIRIGNRVVGSHCFTDME